MSPEIENIRQIVLPILKLHGALKAGLFGSFARGEASAQSDVDILIEMDDAISLLEIAGLKVELEDALGKKVDLVEYNSIKPLIREMVLQEQLSIL
jgi:predicted nucleotidyltransferase